MKVRIDTGCVCEPYVYEVPDAAPVLGRPRFRTEEERIEHARKRAWRDHARKINENYRPDDLHAILTFADDGPHTKQESRRLLDNYRRRLLRNCPDGRIQMVWKGRRVRVTACGIPESMILRMWNCGSVTSMERKRRVEFDKSGLLVTYNGRPLRGRPQRNK